MRQIERRGEERGGLHIFSVLTADSSLPGRAGGCSGVDWSAGQGEVGSQSGAQLVWAGGLSVAPTAFINHRGAFKIKDWGRGCWLVFNPTYVVVSPRLSGWEAVFIRSHHLLSSSQVRLGRNLICSVWFSLV